MILIGALSIEMYPGFLYNFTYLGLFLSYAIELILLGKLSYFIVSKTSPSKITIIKEKWTNFLIITLILAAPVFIVGWLGSLASINPYTVITLKITISLLISAIAIYALPIAFIKNENLKAILVSVYYLFTNINHSKPLLFMLLAAVIIGFIPIALIMSFPTLGIYGIIPTMIASNIVATYIYALIFCAATLSLTNNYESEHEQA